MEVRSRVQARASAKRRARIRHAKTRAAAQYGERELSPSPPHAAMLLSPRALQAYLSPPLFFGFTRNGRGYAIR